MTRHGMLPQSGKSSQPVSQPNQTEQQQAFVGQSSDGTTRTRMERKESHNISSNNKNSGNTNNNSNNSNNNEMLLTSLANSGEMSRSLRASGNNSSDKNTTRALKAILPAPPPSTPLLLLLLLLFGVSNVVRGAIGNANSISRDANMNAAMMTNTAAEMGHGNPHLKSNRTTIVQLFEWKFVDVGAECSNFLGPKGYGGVQLSPVTEHLVISTDSVRRPWWERYQPISYKLDTRSGNEEEFLQMSRDCNAAGVRLYVDVVLNHMAVGHHTSNGTRISVDGEPLFGTAGTQANASTLDYPGVPYASKDFHRPCTLDNYSDAHEVRNCQLDGRPDLDHSRAGVRQRIVALLNKLVDLGAAGFRVDAAKYMWPVDLKSIYSAVNNLNSEEFDFPDLARPFFYHDVLDLGTDSVSKTEYAGYGMVTEYLYAAELSTIISGRVPLSSLINWGPAMGFVPHQDALVFVDNPASQRGSLRELGYNQLLTHKQRRKYIMANAFMLAHPYGRIKRIMSSYRYAENDVDQGPPVMEGDDDDANEDELDAIRSPTFHDESNGQCRPESGWVCEHRWPAIADMIALTNCVCDEQDSVINFQTDGPNHIAFCRGHKAFIAINNDPELDFETELHTCLPAGVYCDVITGGLNDDATACRGSSVTVNEEGNAVIVLPAIDDWDEVADYADADADEDDEGTYAVKVANQAGDLGVIAIYVGSRLTYNETGTMRGDEDGVGAAKVTTATVDAEEIEVIDTATSISVTTTTATTTLIVDIATEMTTTLAATIADEVIAEDITTAASVSVENVTPNDEVTEEQTVASAETTMEPTTVEALEDNEVDVDDDGEGEEEEEQLETDIENDVVAEQ